MPSLPLHRWITPSRLTERWDAPSHLHAISGMEQWPKLGTLARMTEGWRTEDGNASVIRSNDIHDQLLELPDDLLLQSPQPSHFAVGPGDVLLSKFLPFRAAWLPPSVPRYPPNANCIRLMGLSPEWACWLPILLEQPDFAQMLSHRVAGSVMPRIGLTDLRDLPIPPPPPEARRLAVEWADASEALLGIQCTLAALRTEVAGIDAPPLPQDKAPTFYSPAYLTDSLLPEHLALARYQAELEAQRWWPLSNALVQEPARLREDLPPLRLLRLSDANDAFGFSIPEIVELQKATFRLYATPLQPDEVLLSTLGTSPKVLFNHPPAPVTLWLSDQWVRLSSETPGALALLLGLDAVRWQLARAATGVVRQFVGREELGRVRLPYLPKAEMEQLHSRLCSILRRRASVQTRLEKLRSEIKGGSSA